MNTTSLLDTATTIVRSKEFKIVLIGLQLGFLALHYLSAEKEKQHTEREEENNPLLALEP